EVRAPRDRHRSPGHCPSAALERCHREDHARLARRPSLGAARRPAPRTALRIYGVDFTCAPRAAKPITVACAVLQKSVLTIERVEPLITFTEFEALLARPGP